MKISKDGMTIIVSARGPGLKLRDVKPGDVFRFANGSPLNLYVMGQDESYFFLTGSEEFTGRGANSARVVIYPNAEMELGEECYTQEALESATKMVEVKLGDQLTPVLGA